MLPVLVLSFIVAAGATATADGLSHAGCFVSNGTTMLAAAGTDRAAFFEIYIDDDIEVKVCNFKFHVHQKVVVVIPVHPSNCVRFLRA